MAFKYNMQCRVTECDAMRRRVALIVGGGRREREECNKERGWWWEDARGRAWRTSRVPVASPANIRELLGGSVI
eukprot:422485-Rhodomonas_salina.3